MSKQEAGDWRHSPAFFKRAYRAWRMPRSITHALRGRTAIEGTGAVAWLRRAGAGWGAGGRGKGMQC